MNGSCDQRCLSWPPASHLIVQIGHDRRCRRVHRHTGGKAEIGEWRCTGAWLTRVVNVPPRAIVAAVDVDGASTVHRHIIGGLFDERQFGGVSAPGGNNTLALS